VRPSVGVVVPATDDPPTLPRCVEAVRSQLGEGDELVVVERADRPGPAAARNEGAEGLRAELLLFVDADVVVAPGAVERVRRAFAADPELAALFGSYDSRPEAGGVTSRFRNLLHHHVHQSAAGEVSSFWAGLGAIRADEFRRLGGFDQDRYAVPSIEDVELGARLASEGGRIRLDPELQGTHLKRWDAASMVRTDLIQRGVPWVELMMERRSAPAHLNLGWRNRVSVAAALALPSALLLRRPRLGLAALGVLVVANRALYTLLWRALGPGGALAGVGLHVAHLLTAAAAVPIGLLSGARRNGAGR
jgi:GT2 family glycosyltransferase